MFMSTFNAVHLNKNKSLLKVLIFGIADPEEIYGAVEIINLLGLPCEVIQNVDELDDTKNAPVIIVPRSAKMSVEEEEILFNSKFPIISVGYIPHQKICNEIGIVFKEEKMVQPPSFCGIVEKANGTKAPFYFSFKVIRIENNSMQIFGKINSERKEYPGIVIRNTDERIKTFILLNLLQSVTYLFCGAEESSSLPREFFDEYGRINDTKIKDLRKEFMEIPIIEVYQEILFEILQYISRKYNMVIVQKWFHPFNHKITLCLTHDVCGIWHKSFIFVIKNFMKKLDLKEAVMRSIMVFLYWVSVIVFKMHLSEKIDIFRLMPEVITDKFVHYNPRFNFDIFDQIEKESEANHSTYFFQTGLSRRIFDGLNGSIEVDYTLDSNFMRRLIYNLKSKGYEIGLHGSVVSYNDAKQMQSEKLALVSVCRNKHVGMRQHRALIKIPETWRFHAREGFLYDSTYGYPHEIGFRAGTGFPFYPWDLEKKEKIPILEIPIIIGDSELFSKQKPFQTVKRILNMTKNYNSVLTLIWHQHTHREKDKHLIESYREILKYAMEYDTWYTNAKELAEWWNLRSQVIFKDFEVDETEIKFSLYSPRNYDGFSIRIHLPFGASSCKLLANDQIRNNDQVQITKDSILFSFDILKGINNVKVMTK